MAMLIEWGETGDAASLLEALYRVDLDEPEWLDGLWAAAEPLVPGAMAVMTSTYTWAPGQAGFRPRCMRSSEPHHAERAVETADQADEFFLASTAGGSRRVYTFLEMFGAKLAELPVATILLRELGVHDILGLQTLSQGGPHDGANLLVASSDSIELTPRARSTWDRIGAHLAAAARLRRGVVAHPVEGVISPDGRIAHAEGDARTRQAQDALGRAVRAIDRARCRETRTDPQALLEAWRAIVEQRWSLIDVVESDGRRFMLARVNPPAALADATLTSREKQVAALLVQGVPQKAVGYELAMSPSTVAFHVKNIARKVGASSSTELVRILAERRSAVPAPAPSSGT